MAFTMSYGVTPPPAPTETPPKATAPKKPALHRGRKHGDLQAQAQAVFDPALVQSSEVLSPATALDVLVDDAAPHALANRDATE